MATIPTQVPMLPLTTIEDIEAISTACVAEDETVIFALVAEEYEFIYQVPFFYYFGDYGYRLSNLNQMQNIRDGELQSLREISYEERVAIILEGQSAIWLVNNPSLPLDDDIDRFESALAAEGFTICPTTIAENNLHMTYYTSGNSTSCERVVACGGQ
ncbi:MAG: hypothetical protein Q9P01_08040 [Anaerolineae bacterium]|nr:hypothetical protein [Anaerolineae bacterium]